MIKKAAVISGDLISSMSLPDSDRNLVIKKLKETLETIQNKYDGYCRIVKGDYIECATKIPKSSLEIALILKCLIKSIPIKAHLKDSNRIRAFKTYGIRLAIGYGSLKNINIKNDIIDGEAIIYAGRYLTENTTHDKERMTIKNTLTFISQDVSLNENFNVILSLIEELINKGTTRQCEVIYLKLLGNSEKEISNKLNISQPAVNSHSTSIGWGAIENAVNYYKEVIESNKNN